MKLIKYLSLFLFVLMLCFFFTSFAAAGGAGIEPGAGCGLEGVKYDGPPFIGYLTVRLVEGDLYANGTLERKQKPGCQVELTNFLLGPLSGATFSELKGVDYRQTCLERAANFGVCVEFSDEPNLEVIGVGNFTWVDPPEYTEFTARFVIMPLK